MKKKLQLLSKYYSCSFKKKLRLWSVLFILAFLANISNAQVTINFQSLSAGTISTNPYLDPSGYKFTGLNSIGTNESLLVSTVQSTKSIMNTNWESQVVLEKTDGTSFNLTSFSYHGDPWGGIADATVTGTNSSGGTIISSFNGGANFATLTLNWNGLKKVVINYNGGTNSSYGLLDNFIVSSGTTTYAVNTTATNGSVAKSPNQASYNSGTNVTLTATANSGYTFSGWSGDVSTTTNPVTISVNSNKNITANFTANPVTFTVNVTATNGSVTKTPNQATYNSGTNVTLTATANNGYTFSGWSGDVSGSTNPLSVTVNSNKNITANFTLTPINSVTSRGQNTPNEGVAKLVDGNLNSKWLDFSAISWVQFSYSSAQVWNQYNITSGNDAPERDPKNWTIQGSNDGTSWVTLDTKTNQTWSARNQTNSFTFTNSTSYTYYRWDISANGSGSIIQASEFAFSSGTISNYAITITAINGTVSKSPNQATYLSGTTVTLTATANSGYTFSGWSGDASGSNNSLIITMNANKSITAGFTANSGGGSGLLDPNATPATVALWNYLKSINGSKMLTGAWTEYQYGGNAEVVRCTGKMPAIWGNDMNTWYNSRTNPMWNQVWADNIAGFKTAYNRGQILQVNWHWQSPQSLNNGVYAMSPKGEGMGAWTSLTAQQWNDIVTPGTALYNTMIEDLDYHVTGFLKKLVDNNGNPMPIIFRPLHEIDGGWFWWTCASDPAKTASLFKIIQNRIINYHGVHNLIWVYNPGVLCDGGSWPPYNVSEYPRRKAFYPGDAYCDITGIDLYDFDPINRGYYNTSPAKTYRDAWNVMKAIAPTKMTALCEAEAIPDAAKCFNDPNYAPWLYCLPWYAKETDQCAWNNVQFNSPYVINAGDFTQMKSARASVINNTVSLNLNTDLLIYPNPANNKVNLRLSPESLFVLISVFDIMGKEIIRSNVYAGEKGVFQLNTSSLSNGIYFLKIKNGTKNVSGKITIMR